MTSSNDTAVEPPEMRWNGWGDPDRAVELPRAVRALLPLLLGRVPRPAPSVHLDDVQVAPSRLSGADIDALRAVVGDSEVRIDVESRVRRSGGRSTPDLLHRREPRQRAADAVV
ncbi:MAG: FAD-binding oxidoreductase, partial [Actinomycetota bacterium]|nr:FAD-binding oxidoreductase [Actinomycetota bacterium]